MDQANTPRLDLVSFAGPAGFVPWSSDPTIRGHSQIDQERDRGIGGQHNHRVAAAPGRAVANPRERQHNHQRGSEDGVDDEHQNGMRQCVLFQLRLRRIPVIVIISSPGTRLLPSTSKMLLLVLLLRMAGEEKDARAGREGERDEANGGDRALCDDAVREAECKRREERRNRHDA